MTAFVVHANLDCEAQWSGVALARAVQQRISLYGALVTALAPADADVELWTAAAIDPQRVRLPWRIAYRTGTPPRADLAWADAAAKPANDRRLAQRLHPLPGARIITSADDIAAWAAALALGDAHEPASGGAHEPASVAPPPATAWVAKAPWTAAGRDRIRGAGPPTDEQRRALARLLARDGELVLQPWCRRVVDAGVCATVDRAGRVEQHAPHGLVVDARGGFVGIDLAEPALAAGERAELAATVERAGAAIAALGYAGPFAVDAFAYEHAGERRLQPLCEINARYSFGWVARALERRCGTTRLGFGPPPAGARTVIAPGPDGVTAWIA